MIFEVVFGLVLLLVIGDAIYSFVTHKGMIWQKLLAVGKNSYTILWSRGLLMFGLGIDLAAQAADFLGAPGIATALNQYLDSKTLGSIMIGIAVVNEAARRRTLNKATDANNNIVVPAPTPPPAANN